MIAALECRQPDGAVPVWELGFQCWDQASGRHVVFGREFEALTPGEQERALRRNAEIILAVCDELGFAGLRTPNNYWEVSPGEPAYGWLPEDGRWEQTRILRELAGDDLVLVGGTGGVITPPTQGFAEFCYRLFDAPEEIDRMAERCLADGLEAAARMRDLGVEAVVTASDIADNHGPFFNPEQMDRFVLPYLRRWAEGVREMGLYGILHTDGDINPCLEAVAESGIHALQAIDPVAGMDIRQVKRRFGERLCLCGNVDCGLLLTGPPEAVYETTRDLLRDCMPGGGFVLGASNAVVPETPMENYLAMIQAWRGHGRYPCAGASAGNEGGSRTC
jgi:uroporphyrinogen decarboxylase